MNIHPPRTISGDEAKRLYDKLRTVLRVVPSWGCYCPARKPFTRGTSWHEHRYDWPLVYWRGPGTSPLVLRWGGEGKPPTFKEFMLAYNLELDPQCP